MSRPTSAAAAAAPPPVRLRPAPFYNDFTPLAHVKSPFSQAAAAVPSSRARLASATYRDRVGDLIAGTPIDPSAERRLGRAMQMRDPNSESDPQVASKRHPKLFDSHVRRVEPAEHVDAPAGKRYVPAPERPEPREDIPELAGAHKRPVCPADPTHHQHAYDAVAELLVDPESAWEELPAKHTQGAARRPQSSAAAGDPTGARRAKADREAVGAFVQQRSGGLRALWVRLVRGEFLTDADGRDIAVALPDGSVTVEALWYQFENVMGRPLDPMVFAAIAGERPGISLPELARALDC